jgi:hypothetical protein
MLPRKLAQGAPEAERRRWRIIRLDTHAEMPGEIVSADVDSGVCVMRERGPDEVDAEGGRKPTYKTSNYSLGPGGFAIIGR